MTVKKITNMTQNSCNSEDSPSSDVVDDKLKYVPLQIIEKLASGGAFCIDEAEKLDYERYLEGVDEGIIEERLVRAGSNGATRVRLFAVETSKDTRKKNKLPKYLMSKKITDFVGDINLQELKTNVSASKRNE